MEHKQKEFGMDEIRLNEKELEKSMIKWLTKQELQEIRKEKLKSNVTFRSRTRLKRLEKRLIKVASDTIEIENVNWGLSTEQVRNQIKKLIDVVYS